MRVSPGGPIVAEALPAGSSADETLGPWINVLGCTNVSFYPVSVGTTSSGVITYEECGPRDVTTLPLAPIGLDTGKYSAITTQNASAFTGTAQQAVHITNASFLFVRARISTAIGGGGTIGIVCVAY